MSRRQWPHEASAHYRDPRRHRGRRDARGSDSKSQLIVPCDVEQPPSKERPDESAHATAAVGSGHARDAPAHDHDVSRARSHRPEIVSKSLSQQGVTLPSD